MRKNKTLLVFCLSVLSCILPFALLPPLCALLPAEPLYLATYVLSYFLCPVLSVIFPFIISRHAVAPIAAWPWPLVGALLLPLWGIRPSFVSLGISFFIGIVSAVCGDELRKRKEE